MTVRRISALFVALLTAGLSVATATWSAAATYPPDVEGTSTGVQDTGVLGTKVSNDVANNVGGLPHTGFSGGLIWTAVALLVVGLGLLLVSRRRGQTD